MRAAYVAARMAELAEPPTQPLPRVSLIVPLTNPHAGLRETLHSLATQDYPDYELILAAPHADAIPPDALPAKVKVALGGNPGRIPLLLAGLRAARRQTEVFAFTGSNGVVSEFWLRALVAPLADEAVGASTGFRSYAPDPPTFWSLMQSVWNSVIAGTLGPGGNHFAWGGALAITKNALLEARGAECWEDAERDDLTLARALRESGRLIAFAPGALVVCDGRTTARQFFRQARREMALALKYVPRLWWGALVSHIIYCGAMLASVIASARGNRGAEWALVALFGLGMLKGANRATLAKAQLPQSKSWFDRYSWTHIFWLPLATWVWLYLLIASLWDRRRAGVL
jgi:cellulose synthase/poly-beta-1,6-N-acetylglucosamine synthase-like glycosyltransferase